jgi:hypothetical protein
MLSYDDYLLNEEITMTERTREKVGRIPLTLSNVYAGRVFSSYRDLCKELGLEIKTGEAKINQMKDLNKVLKISTEGYKIRIEEIRDGEELKEIERMEVEERLEKDCEMGRGVFKDRLNLFMIMVWEKMMGGKEIPSGGFTDYKHFSDDKKELVFYPKEVYPKLHLVQEQYEVMKKEAKTSPTNQSEITWSFRVVDSQNKAVTLRLFNKLYSSSLVTGYKTYEVTVLGGEVTVCDPATSLLITEILEHRMAEMGCRSLYDIHFNNLDREFYKSTNKTLYDTYGVTRYEECFVLTTSEFLLSRYMVKNFSRINQQAILKKSSNNANVVSLGKHRDNATERAYFAASGVRNTEGDEKASKLISEADQRETILSIIIDNCVMVSQEDNNHG